MAKWACYIGAKTQGEGGNALSKGTCCCGKSVAPSSRAEQSLPPWALDTTCRGTDELAAVHQGGGGAAVVLKGMEEWPPFALMGRSRRGRKREARSQSRCHPPGGRGVKGSTPRGIQHPVPLVGGGPDVERSLEGTSRPAKGYGCMWQEAGLGRDSWEQSKADGP